MANTKELLNQIKEAGFNFYERGNIKLLKEVFGEPAFNEILYWAEDCPAEGSLKIIKQKGFVYFRDRENDEQSPITGYRVSDISSFQQFSANDKDYIQFTMGSGMTIKKVANTGMAQALIDYFYADISSRYVTPGAEKCQHYGSYININ